MNGDSELPGYTECGRISCVGVKVLLLVSDGYDAPKAAHCPKVDGAVKLALRVYQIGLQPYLDWLSRLEEIDPECV